MFNLVIPRAATSTVYRRAWRPRNALPRRATRDIAAALANSRRALRGTLRGVALYLLQAQRRQNPTLHPASPCQGMEMPRRVRGKGRGTQGRAGCHLRILHSSGPAWPGQSPCHCGSIAPLHCPALNLRVARPEHCQPTTLGPNTTLGVCKLWQNRRAATQTKNQKRGHRQPRLVRAGQWAELGRRCTEYGRTRWSVRGSQRFCLCCCFRTLLRDGPATPTSTE